MKSDISVVCATFGDEVVWGPLAMRALESVATQTLEPASISRVHGHTLAEARNQGAQEATGAWLVFVDADDELHAGYLEAMQQVVDIVSFPALLKPSTLGVYEDGTTDDHAVMIERRDLLVSNHLIIGTGMRRSGFLAVGGFAELPILEDWHLFLRLHLAGAQILDVPDAVYRVGVCAHSRNQDPVLHGQVYQRIRDEMLCSPR